MEWKLFENKSYVSTYEFHKDREAAPHIDQEWHQPRLYKTIEVALWLLNNTDAQSVCDLGAGDGGMLQMLQSQLPPNTRCWGYDFQPANIEYATTQRKVNVRSANFLEDDIVYGDITTCTEVIEHLEDPHGFLRKLSYHTKYLICSSPYNERDDFHCEEHAWAFDLAGYQNLLKNNGWFILEFYDLYPFQLYMCQSKHV